MKRPDSIHKNKWKSFHKQRKPTSITWTKIYQN